MHEISLCQSVLKIIEQQAAQQHYSRVKTVFLEIGQLAAVEPEALRFGFDVVMKDSIAAGAKLEIIHVPAQAWCPHCQQQVAVQQRFDACPDCGASALQISVGEELRVKELEVEFVS